MKGGRGRVGVEGRRAAWEESRRRMKRFRRGRGGRCRGREGRRRECRCARRVVRARCRARHGRRRRHSSLSWRSAYARRLAVRVGSRESWRSLRPLKLPGRIRASPPSIQPRSRFCASPPRCCCREPSRLFPCQLFRLIRSAQRGDRSSARAESDVGGSIRDTLRRRAADVEG